MIFTDRIAQAIAVGTVSHVYRRWSRPRIQPDTRLHTTAGVVEIETITPIDPDLLTDNDARAADERNLPALLRTFRASTEEPVCKIHIKYVGIDERIELRNQKDLSQDECSDITAALARLDTASRRGEWTHTLLTVIAENPGRKAAELAVLVHREKESLKLDVRRLKNLGLTESVQTGYELSPRGASYLRAIS